MKRMTILVFAAALLWAGYWAWQASVTRSAIETWFETRRDAGWQASYSDLTLRGFPNRLDVTLSDVTLQAPDGPLWQAPFFQSFQLIYRPGHRIFAFPETMTLGALTVGSQGLRASMVETGGTVERANLEADVLNLTGTDSTLALAGVTAAFGRTAPQTYQFAVAAQGIAGPQGPIASGSSDGLRLNARLAFDAPWHSGTLLDRRPQPTRLDLDLLEFEQGALVLKLAGALDIDSAGRGTGRITLRAENWRDLLQGAADRGQLAPGAAQAITEGLTLYSRLTGNGEDLDLPLDFNAGDLRLGPIPLGQGPLFRLP